MLSSYKQQRQISEDEFANTVVFKQEDREMIVDYIKHKRQKLLNREGVLNQLFGIQNYVQLNCSNKSDFSNPTSLLNKCVSFIKRDTSDPSQQPPVLVIEGRSGSGKSLFLIELLRHINRLYQEQTLPFMHVYFLKLREHSEGYVQANPLTASSLAE